MAVTSVLLAITSGLVLASGFAPLEFWPGPFLALGILFHLLRDRDFLQRLLISFITGLSFFLPLLHWSSSYVGAIPWLILAIGQATLFSLVAIPRLPSGINGPLTFSSAFLLVELLRSKFPFGGFGWGRVGFTQIDSISNLYPYLGVAGISMLVVFLSSLSVFKVKYFLIAILFLGLFSITNMASPERLAASSQTTKLSLVQGGVANLGFAYNDEPLDVLKRHVEASPKNFPGEIIIWPENSVDIDPQIDRTARKLIDSVLKDNDDVYLLTGNVEQTPRGPRNAAVLYRNSSKPIAHYVKQDLAPFGEYIPWRSLAESISPYAGQVRDFVPGKKWVRFKVNQATFQSFICFEILDDDHVRSGSENMDFLITQTNNATFGRSAQAAQQLQITRARAAELNKEIAVVSTTGYSGLIDNSGNLVEKIPQFEPGNLEIEIEHRPTNSIAGQLGSFFWLLVGFLALLLTNTTRYINRR